MRKWPHIKLKMAFAWTVSPLERWSQGHLHKLWENLLSQRWSAVSHTHFSSVIPSAQTSKTNANTGQFNFGEYPGWKCISSTEKIHYARFIYLFSLRLQNKIYSLANDCKPARDWLLFIFLLGLCFFLHSFLYQRRLWSCLPLCYYVIMIASFSLTNSWCCVTKCHKVFGRGSYLLNPTCKVQKQTLGV